MSNTLSQLRTFCLQNDLYFPKFKANYSNSLVKYEAFWYSTLIYTSDYFTTDDQALKSCVIFLSEWLKSEKNYLNLLEYEEASKMVVV